MTREREWFADHGYIALHVDYRNHAGSDDTDVGEADLRMGYTEDVINAVLALRDWDGPVDDDRMAVGGRSMGGGVVYNVLVAQPGLVDAGGGLGAGQLRRRRQLQPLDRARPGLGRTSSTRSTGSTACRATTRSSGTASAPAPTSTRSPNRC